MTRYVPKYNFFRQMTILWMESVIDIQNVRRKFAGEHRTNKY